MDPNLEESMLIDGFLIIGTNHRDEICLIYQCGNLNIQPQMVKSKDDKKLIKLIRIFRLKNAANSL